MIFKCPRIYKLETPLGKNSGFFLTQVCFEEKKKLRVRIVKCAFLRIISPVFSALGLVLGVSGILDYGCQVVLIHESVIE